jgi:hypothetical protein
MSDTDTRTRRAQRFEQKAQHAAKPAPLHPEGRRMFAAERRCAICHRDAHAAGTWQGHWYE